MTFFIMLQNTNNEANAESACADCETTNTCVVTCLHRPSNPVTPICGNYGSQPCSCGPIVFQ